MPTIFNVVLLVVLFNLCTLIGLDARPHPNDFLVLKNLRNVILRSSDTTTRLTPRGEVAPATSFDQPIKITTIFDPLFSEPTFTGSTIFDPFHPSEAGRSIPATPKAAQLTPVSTGPDPINSDYITSSWDTGTGLATSITQLVTFYTPEFTVCPIRPVGSGYSLLAVQGAQNDTATPPYSNSSGPPTTTCSTHYTSAVTPVCRTTITPLGNFPITITDCKQNVTFSTDHGCTLLKNRMLVSKTTNYVAPWDSVVTGVPQGVVQAEVCQHGGPCTTYHELWGVRVVMVTLASTSTLEISAVITGPSEVVYANSQTIVIRESVTTTLSISTIMDVVTVERSPVIFAATLDPPAPSTTLRTTVYSTRTVKVTITVATNKPSRTILRPPGVLDG